LSAKTGIGLMFRSFFSSPVKDYYI